MSTFTISQVGNTTAWGIPDPPALVVHFEKLELRTTTIPLVRSDMSWADMEREISAAEIRIAELSRLEDGWGPYRGRKVSRGVLENSVAIMRDLRSWFKKEYAFRARVFAAAGSDGSICIEVDGKKKSLAFTLVDGDFIEVLREQNDIFDEKTSTAGALDLEAELDWLSS